MEQKNKPPDFFYDIHVHCVLVCLFGVFHPYGGVTIKGEELQL